MNDDQPTFSALNMAEQLSPEQLEYITEFSDQIESLRYLSRNLTGPAPTIDQALEIVAAAPAVLKRKRRGSGEISDADRAWHAELGSEFIKREDKDGDRLPAVLSLGEILALLEASRPDKRDHLLFCVFYASGMRISEVAKLLVADLYLPELKILVRDGKGDKDRYVIIDPDTAELLTSFTAGLGPKEKVFEIGERQISRVLKGYADDLGISDRYAAMGRNFSPHSLRHTCATHLYELGMDIYMIKELLGHSSITVTREYVHIGINRLRTNYQNCHPLCKRKDDD